MSRNAFTRRSVLAGSASLASLAITNTVLGRQKASEIRVVQPWEFKTLQPSRHGWAFTRPGLAETMVLSELDGRIVPGIAESWTVAPDGRMWSFKLRRGARFHDLSPVAPDVVKASFERLLPKSNHLKSINIRSIETTNEGIVFRLKDPIGPFLSFLLDPSVPVLAPASFDSKGNVRSLISTGPFRLLSADLPRRLVLERNEAYWGGNPFFTRATYEAVQNADTRANIAATGDADVVLNIPASSVARVTVGESARIDRIVIPRVHILMPNCAKPQFSDVRSRQALSLAIDRDGIATGIMRNAALAATQYLPPTLALWHSEDLRPHRRNIDAANRLLDQAEWSMGPDGIRVKDGLRFAGTVRTFANRPELPVIATALQAQFKAVGFELSIEVGDWHAIVEGQRDGSLELGLSSRNLAAVPDPIASLTSDFGADTPGSNAAGSTNWQNSRIRSDFRAYMSSVNESDRVHLRRRIAAVLQEELPVIPVVWYDQIIAVNNRISNFLSDPFEQRLFLERLTS